MIVNNAVRMPTNDLVNVVLKGNQISICTKPHCLGRRSSSSLTEILDLPSTLDRVCWLVLGNLV